MFRFLVQRNHSDDVKVYSHTQQDMMLFFKQHNINGQNINVEYVDTIKDSQEQHVLKLYKFRSNKSPELFGKSIRLALKYLEKKPYEKRILFAHSWNEWGEGAYLEPDLKYGLRYLEQITKYVLG